MVLQFHLIHHMILIVDFHKGMKYPNRTYSVHCCEGLVIDVLQSLSSDIGFNYQVYISPDGMFGSFNSNTANWTGMVKELLDGMLPLIFYYYAAVVFFIILHVV